MLNKYFCSSFLKGIPLGPPKTMIFSFSKYFKPISNHELIGYASLSIKAKYSESNCLDPKFLLADIFANFEMIIL